MPSMPDTPQTLLPQHVHAAWLSQAQESPCYHAAHKSQYPPHLTSTRVLAAPHATGIRCPSKAAPVESYAVADVMMTSCFDTTSVFPPCRGPAALTSSTVGPDAASTCGCRSPKLATVTVFVLGAGRAPPAVQGPRRHASCGLKKGVHHPVGCCCWHVLHAAAHGMHGCMGTPLLAKGPCAACLLARAAVRLWLLTWAVLRGSPAASSSSTSAARTSFGSRRCPPAPLPCPPMRAFSRRASHRQGLACLGTKPVQQAAMMGMQRQQMSSVRPSSSWVRCP